MFLYFQDYFFAWNGIPVTIGMKSSAALNNEEKEAYIMELSIEMLRSITLLRDLDDGEADRFRSIAVPRTLPRKTKVFREGEVVEAVYFILHGLIKTYKTDEIGNEQIVSLLKTGDMFPHTGQFDGNLYPATAVTVVDTRLLVVPIRSFEQILSTTPSIAFKMMGVMSSKIRELQDKLQGFTQRDVEDRGVSFLIKLAENFGIEQDGEIHINVPMTHQDFASFIGSTRETVTRLLNNLRKDGILLVSRKGFIIRNLQALKERICIKENCPHCREIRLHKK